MRILNFGSLNIDRVYTVEDFVKSGETISAKSLELFSGGKGLNQSVAMARAGAEVFHAGAVGTDGEELKKTLCDAGVDSTYIEELDTFSGHAVIQLNHKGQNSIIVQGGSNMQVTKEQIDATLSNFKKGDILVLQNEISNIDYIIKEGKKIGMIMALNPSPITKNLFSYPIDLLDYILVNETEAQALAGKEGGSYLEILNLLCKKYPEAGIVLTVGEDGAYYKKDGQEYIYNQAYKVDVVDTTAAGDTFCGYFIASIAKNEEAKTAIKKASLASSLAVSKMGASPSIPTIKEVNHLLDTRNK